MRLPCLCAKLCRVYHVYRLTWHRPKVVIAWSLEVCEIGENGAFEGLQDEGHQSMASRGDLNKQRHEGWLRRSWELKAFERHNLTVEDLKTWRNSMRDVSRVPIYKRRRVDNNLCRFDLELVKVTGLLTSVSIQLTNGLENHTPYV